MIGRYLQAFWKALRLTVQGQRASPGPLRQPKIQQWAKRTLACVDAVREAADSSGITREQRKALMVRIDKRDVSLETLLQTIRHHALTEYPYLLKDYTSYSLMAIQASNLNDQYWVSRFVERDSQPERLRRTLVSLAEHLAAIPPADLPETTP